MNQDIKGNTNKLLSANGRIVFTHYLISNLNYLYIIANRVTVKFEQ